MAIDLSKILNYVAPAPMYVGKLKDVGLITDKDLATARNQSAIQGLLSAGLTYLAQPKNQGYGSIMPYAARSLQAGLGAAQVPMQRLGESAMMEQQINELKYSAVTRERKEALIQELLQDPEIANNPLLKASAVNDPVKTLSALQRNKRYANRYKNRSIDRVGKEGVIEKVYQERVDTDGDGFPDTYKDVSVVPKYKPESEVFVPQETVDYYAGQIIRGNNEWKKGLARDKVGRKIMSQAVERAPTLAEELQVTPGDLASVVNRRKALTSVLTQRENFTAATNKYIRMFEKQIGLVKELKQGLAGANPAINRWIQAGRKAILGDPDVTALDAAIKGAAREHMRIVTGATSNAQLHAEAQTTADELLNSAQTPDQVEAVLKVMEKEAKSARQSGLEELEIINEKIRVLGGGKYGEFGKPGTVGAGGQSTIERADGSTSSSGTSLNEVLIPVPGEEGVFEVQDEVAMEDLIADDPEYGEEFNIFDDPDYEDLY
jgi:hypothetical protein